MNMHNHHHHSHKDLRSGRLLLSIFLNLLITLFQAIGGWVSGSLSLLSDALHNLSDVISLLVSYIATKLSKKKPSFKRTFGYKRAEILAAFVNAASLIVVAVLLIIEAIERFKTPQPIATNLVIWLSIFAILGNGFSVLLLKGDAHKNLNMKSAYLHLITDLLASVAVLIGGLLMKFYDAYWVDSALTLSIGLYLIYVGFQLLSESTKMMMLFTPKQIDLSKVVDAVNELPKVKQLHHVHLWNLSDDELHLEAHLDLEEDLTVTQFNELLTKLENLLEEQFEINHITIQPEYEKDDSKEVVVHDWCWK